MCQFLTFTERIKEIEHGEREAIILNISIKGGDNTREEVNRGMLSFEEIQCLGLAMNV